MYGRLFAKSTHVGILHCTRPSLVDVLYTHHTYTHTHIYLYYNIGTHHHYNTLYYIIYIAVNLESERMDLGDERRPR